MYYAHTGTLTRVGSFTTSTHTHTQNMIRTRRDDEKNSIIWMCRRDRAFAFKLRSRHSAPAMDTSMWCRILTLVHTNTLAHTHTQGGRVNNLYRNQSGRGSRQSLRPKQINRLVCSCNGQAKSRKFFGKLIAVHPFCVRTDKKHASEVDRRGRGRCGAVMLSSQRVAVCTNNTDTQKPILGARFVYSGCKCNIYTLVFE